MSLRRALGPPPPLGADVLGAGEEVPVRRTFIQFGLSELHGPADDLPQALSTAPASAGRSISESLEAVEDYEGYQLPSASVTGSHSGVSSEVAVTYRLSPTSARAAGCWRPTLANAELVAGNPQSGAGTPESRGAGGRRIRLADLLPSPGSSTTAPMFFGQASGDAASNASSEDDANSSASGDEEDQGPCLVYSESVEPPSAGSVAHGEGSCRRCCFFPKGRCNNGQDCQFCHFSHEKRRPKNKKKKTRARRRRPTLSDTGMAVAPGPQQEFVPGTLLRPPINPGMISLGSLPSLYEDLPSGTGT